jgi:hypothetical protein
MSLTMRVVRMRSERDERPTCHRLLASASSWRMLPLQNFGVSAFACIPRLTHSTAPPQRVACSKVLRVVVLKSSLFLLARV